MDIKCEVYIKSEIEDISETEVKIEDEQLEQEFSFAECVVRM